MTNLSGSTTSASNMGWEVAGGKKLNKNKPDVKSTTGSAASAKNGPASLAKQIPRVEGLQPLKLEKTIYDVFRDSDGDSADGMDELNNNRVKSSNNKQQQAKPANGVPNSPPKPVKKQPTASQQESLNLLASSMAASSQKSKKPTSTARTPEQEFENALGQINLADMEKELTNLTALFPSSWLSVNQQLAIYLNQRFYNVADFDPNPNHENETASLLQKADAKLVKLLNGTISRLNKVDAEKLYEFLFQSVFADSNKSPSNHGFKIYIQLMLKHAGGLDVATYASKLNDIMNAQKHRHQRCLIALWALSQIGYVNLSNGFNVWFECMLPVLNAKGAGVYVATYLNALITHHKLSKDSNLASPLVDLDQYGQLFDVLNADKAVLNSTVGKDAALKLRQAFDLLRALLTRDMATRSPDLYFERLLADLKTESSAKQTDLLDMLVSLVLTGNKQVLAKWKQIYSKHIGQSVYLLEHLSERHLKSFKSIKSIGETLRFFDEHSDSLLAKQIGQKDSAPGAKTNFYAKNKANKSTAHELDQLKKFNRLVKQLISRYFRRTSRFSMVLRSIFIIALGVGLFFYWDVNSNKSIYTNSIQLELKKYGLLEPTLKLINSVKNLLWTIQTQLAHYIPIWYQKFNQTVTPVVLSAWSSSKAYAQLAWTNSAPYRQTVIVYVNEGVEFIHQNFPVVMKNLISVVQLAINYATTVTNFVVYYIFQGFDFVGMQLLGWKQGDLEKAFVDALKVSIEYLTQLFQRLTAYLNQK